MHPQGDLKSSDDREMTISALARAAGVAPSAVRYYESVGVLPEPDRVAGQRRYGPEDVRRLGNIRTAQRAGLALADIRDLLGANGSDEPLGVHMRELAARRLPTADEELRQVQAARRWLEAAARCTCVQLDECALLNPHRAEEIGCARHEGCLRRAAGEPAAAALAGLAGSRP